MSIDKSTATRRLALPRGTHLDQPLPLHQQLREKLRGQILEGVYSPGDRIPTEAEMVSHYKISRVTARRALQDLVHEGLLIGVKGKGTFVNPSPFTSVSTYLFVYALEAGLDYPYTGALLQGISRQNTKSVHFRLEMLPLPPRTLQSHGDDRVEDLVSHGQIQGVIALPRLQLATIEHLIDQGIPVVQIGLIAQPLPKGCVSISIAGEAGIEMALDHLCQRGRSRLGFIDQPSIASSSDDLRDRFAARQLPFDDSALEVGMWGINGGIKAATQLLKRRPDLDGIITSDDLQAFGAMRAAEAAGRTVGQDIGIVGIGGLMGEHSHAGLTTVDMHVHECGAAAVQCLQKLVRGEPVNAVHETRPSLVVRDSS